MRSRQEHPMVMRYLELCRAGPNITPEDEKRLRDFTPKPKAIAVYVHYALRQIGAESMRRRFPTHQGAGA